MKKIDDESGVDEILFLLINAWMEHGTLRSGGKPRPVVRRPLGLSEKYGPRGDCEVRPMFYWSICCEPTIMG